MQEINGITVVEVLDTQIKLIDNRSYLLLKIY